MKVCSKCKVEKETSEFTKNKSKNDGLDNYCLLCTREASRKHRELKRESNSNDWRKGYDKKYSQTKGFKSSQKRFSSKTSYHKIWKKKGRFSLSSWYIKRVLKDRHGYTDEQLERNPEIIIIYTGIIKLKRYVKQKNKGNLSKVG